MQRVDVPLHTPPDQPVNRRPDEALAVSVTEAPDTKFAEHVVPQLMPVGLDDTEPGPDTVTASVYSSANVAVAVRAPLIVTVHVVVVPEQLPDQPVNRDAGDREAAAVSVTLVPELKYAVHSTPQFTPPTFEVTVPDPAPDFAAVSRYCAVNVAVTLRAALIASTQVPVPVHDPDQPENT